MLFRVARKRVTLNIIPSLSCYKKEGRKPGRLFKKVPVDSPYAVHSYPVGVPAERMGFP